MIYFFHRGQSRMTCEARLDPDGGGYQLIVREDDREHTERYATLPALMGREHELLQAWRATGWQETTTPAQPRKGSGSYKHIRELKGNGQLEAAGQPSLAIRYEIHVVTVEPRDGSNGPASVGTLEIDGWVFPGEATELEPYVGAAVLILADGKRWECVVENTAGRLSFGRQLYT